MQADSHFFHRASFSLGKIAEHSGYLDLADLAGLFTRINKVSSLCQGSHWWYLGLIINLSFPRKVECWKTCVHSHELYSFRILKDFSDDIKGDSNTQNPLQL